MTPEVVPQTETPSSPVKEQQNVTPTTDGNDQNSSVSQEQQQQEKTEVPVSNEQNTTPVVEQDEQKL